MNRGRSQSVGRGYYSAPRGRGRPSRPADYSADRHRPGAVNKYSNESSGRDEGPFSARWTASEGDWKSPSMRQSRHGVGRAHAASIASRQGDGNSQSTRQSSLPVSDDDNSMQFEQVTPVGCLGQQWPPPRGARGNSHTGRYQLSENKPKHEVGCSKQSDDPVCFTHENHVPSSSLQCDFKGKDFRSSGTQVKNHGKSLGDVGSLALDQSFMENIAHLHDESHLPAKSATGNRYSHDKGPIDALAFHPKDDRSSQNSENLPPADQFDICPPKASTGVKLNPSLLEMNREKRKDAKRSMGDPRGTILRAGMILLKNYISSSEQAKIVKICRQLGMGDGGFYQPGYRDGAKLHLKMMCLGMNWDPEKSEYGIFRPMDGAKPPNIPDEFKQLVERAMNDSHALIVEQTDCRNVKDILPSMRPDICLVNFYSASGRLGLHQDRDESQESLRMGLPVVSFSIGDSAEFLYGDEKEVDKADKIMLESGDVLIFGGKSRHIFHGVATIIPNTAPKSLLAETNLRQGRLNLTYRQY
ncbi:hypothetical protein Ancab_011908 [Ancistrocladus abbreviatus]